jgi:hypothetical protein
MSSTLKNHYGSAINDDKMQVSFMCTTFKEIIATADDAARVIVSFIEVYILLPVNGGAPLASAAPLRKTSKQDAGERVTAAASASAAAGCKSKAAVAGDKRSHVSAPAASGKSSDAKDTPGSLSTSPWAAT